MISRQRGGGRGRSATYRNFCTEINIFDGGDIPDTPEGKNTRLIISPFSFPSYFGIQGGKNTSGRDKPRAGDRRRFIRGGLQTAAGCQPPAERRGKMARSEEKGKSRILEGKRSGYVTKAGLQPDNRSPINSTPSLATKEACLPLLLEPLIWLLLSLRASSATRFLFPLLTPVTASIPMAEGSLP